MSFVIKPIWGEDNLGPTVKLWEIGWMNSDRSDGDRFEIVRQTQHLEEAAILCNYLNGGRLPKDEDAIELVENWFDGVQIHRYRHRHNEE